MDSSYRNIIVLSFSSFLFLNIYVGVHNYLRYHYLETGLIDILLMGFRYQTGVLINVFIGLLFSLIGNFYLKNKHQSNSVFKITIALVIIMFAIIVLVRMAFYSFIIEGLEISLLMTILIQSVFFIPFFGLVLFPIVSLLIRSYKYSKPN